MEKGRLGGGVYGFHRGNGGVGGGLAAADEVDFGKAGVTGEGEGRGERDAGGAADWVVLISWKVSKRGGRVEGPL